MFHEADFRLIQFVSNNTISPNPPFVNLF
jgi:hypothetical protein